MTSPTCPTFGNVPVIIDRLITSNCPQIELEWAMAALQYCRGLSLQSLRACEQVAVIDEHAVDRMALELGQIEDLERYIVSNSVVQIAQRIQTMGGVMHTTYDHENLTIHQVGITVILPKIRPVDPVDPGVP